MNRILKVFSSGSEQESLAENYAVIQRYPAFLLLDIPTKRAKRWLEIILPRTSFHSFEFRPAREWSTQRELKFPLQRKRRSEPPRGTLNRFRVARTITCYNSSDL